MKRIVLLIRVSSDKQQTESQRIELINFCQNENYTLDDMYIIENKESATKNEELRGLTELKQVIDDYPIEAVYVWELSRLSRRREVLNQMYDIFLNRKINLICKQENARLFDHNGEVNVMTLTMFDFMKNMVVQDTKLRIERTTRGRNASFEKFKYGGGGLTFGYYVDENKDFQINEEQAKVVRTIFELYSSGLHSASTIHKELISRGIRPENNFKIYNILKNRSYTGKQEKSYRSKNEHKYPAIITNKIFEECEKIRLSKDNRKSDKAKNIYYAGRLIKCSCCGKILIPKVTNRQFECPTALNKVKVNEQPVCPTGDRININIVDSLAIDCAVLIDEIENQKFDTNQIEQMNEKIKELNNKINQSENKFQVIRNDKHKQLKKVLSYLTETELKQHVERALKSVRLEIEKELIDYKMEIERLTNIVASKNEIYSAPKAKKINSFPVKPSVVKMANMTLDPVSFVSELTEKQRYDLVHKYIKEINVTNEPFKVKKITIHSFDDNNKTFYYNSKSKIYNKKLYQMDYRGEKKYLEWNKFIIKHIDC